MVQSHNIYPNEIIFVKKTDTLTLPKEELEYLVEKRNDFDNLEKLVKYYPVQDGTIELKISNPEYSKSFKHGDIYNLNQSKSTDYSEEEQISGKGFFLNNVYKINRDSFSIFGSRRQINEVSVAIHNLRKNITSETDKQKYIEGKIAQEDFDFSGIERNGFFSLSCGKASSGLEYVFDEEFYLEVFLDNSIFNDLLEKIHHQDFEAIIVRANLGAIKGIYAEKPTGVYTENGFITDGQSYKFLYEKSNVTNYTEMPDNFDAIGSITKENPFIVDVYYSSKKIKGLEVEDKKNASLDFQKKEISTIRSKANSLKFNIIILYIFVITISITFINQFL